MMDFPDLATASSDLNRWLSERALPLWWEKGADHVRGGFFETLAQDASPLRGNRRMRVHARQAHVYATAPWNGPAQAAVRHGLDYLFVRYQRPDGLFRTLIGDDGSPADDTALLYDQAFVLLALAAASARGYCDDAAARAHALLTRIREQPHPAGGFVEQPIQDSCLQSNPHMHLLEASLAWETAEPDGPWQTLSDAIVALCRRHFIDPVSGVLREFFADDGSPMPGAAGRLVEPGHQFEWAWLLTRWSLQRGDMEVAALARRLYQVGAAGVDPERRVAMEALDERLAIVSTQARLWPQTERLKAALIMAQTSPDLRGAFERDALAAASVLWRYLQTPVAGLWRDKMKDDGGFVEEPAPASSFYHIACAILELQAFAA